MGGTVFWIDQNNDKEENQEYLKHYSEDLKDFSFILVTSVEKGYSCLKKYCFKLIYVILSGRLAEEFLDLYEENLQKLNVITLNVIFCFNGKYHKLKKYANDPFYNPGGIVTDFKEVIQFLKKDIKYKITSPKISNQKINYSNNNNEKSFIFISKNIKNLSYPIIFKKLAPRFINEDEFEKFKEFMCNNYYDILEKIDLLNIYLVVKLKFLIIFFLKYF